METESTPLTNADITKAVDNLRSAELLAFASYSGESLLIAGASGVDEDYDGNEILQGPIFNIYREDQKFLAIISESTLEPCTLKHSPLCSTIGEAADYVIRELKS